MGGSDEGMFPKVALSMESRMNGGGRPHRRASMHVRGGSQHGLHEVALRHRMLHYLIALLHAVFQFTNPLDDLLCVLINGL